VKWLFAMSCLFFAAASFGVRLHPDKAASFLQRENFENYYEIEFFSGQRLAGKLVSESSETIEITLGAGTTRFKKNEIKGSHLLDSKAVAGGEYSDIIFRPARKASSWVSMSYEDSLFYAAEKRAGLLFSGIAEKLPQESKALPPLKGLSRDEASAPQVEPNFLARMGLPSAGIASTAVRGLAAENNQEQDYTALITAGLEKLRNSKK